VAYKLELPHQWNIHPVFHTSLLTPYVETIEHGPNYSRPPPDLMGGEEQYEVETIHSHRCHGQSRQLQYLLKWKGYPESDNTWEPATQVHSPDLVKQYHRKRPLNSIKSVLIQQQQNNSAHLAIPKSKRSVPHLDLKSLFCSYPYTTHKFHIFRPGQRLHTTHQHALVHPFFCKENYCQYHR
jgi:hypothetical protein